MDNDLLTDEEMAVVQGDKERCLAVIGAFGTCDGCSAYCRGISKAQSAKTKAALVAEGWKSPAEVAKARQGWLYEGRMAEREKMKRFIAQARADERKAIGKWIEHTYPTYGPDYLVPIKDVDALLKGERQ
jgi:hypothetical protein